MPPREPGPALPTPAASRSPRTPAGTASPPPGPTGKAATVATDPEPHAAPETHQDSPAPVIRFLAQQASTADQLLLFANGQRIAAALHVVAQLDIAALLADGECDVETLARATGCHASSLERVLRCTALIGVFTESSPGRFSLTPAAELLCSDRPDSLRPVVLLDNSVSLARSLTRLLSSVREGKPGFAQEYGASFTGPPQEGVPESVRTARSLHAQVTTALSRGAAEQCLAHHQELGAFGRVADLTPGDGLFLRELLHRRPEATGVFVGPADQVAVARRPLRSPETSERIEALAVDILDPEDTGALPQDCDAYLLRAVLHALSDEAAGAVLRRVREAIGERKARLLVLDHVVAAGDAWDPAKILDIDMLAVYGGRERNAAQWHRLLRAAGFAAVDHRCLGTGPTRPAHEQGPAASSEEPAAWSLLVAHPD